MSYLDEDGALAPELLRGAVLGFVKGAPDGRREEDIEAFLEKFEGEVREAQTLFLLCDLIVDEQLTMNIDRFGQITYASDS